MNSRAERPKSPSATTPSSPPQWIPPASPRGDFERKDVTFRHWVRADGSTPFLPEKDRYHLYVSLACPWAHRTVMMRRLRKLEDVISLSVVNPLWNEQGWCFDPGPGVIPDTVNHQHNLIDIYRLADPSFNDDETTPVLWDKKLGTIVNNESRDIIRMLDLEFRDFGDRSLCLAPQELLPQIDETITAIYRPINNGVYRCGFATTQEAYGRAFRELFAALDHWNGVLGTRRYLCGERLTEADLCLFATLVRFDPVYYAHFKCNQRRIIDYRHLGGYVRDLFQTPGIGETCDFDHIKGHYYGCHKQLNPSGIIPLGPDLTLDEPHGRERF